MPTITIIEDLFEFNSWANGRILSLSEGLTDEELDRPREMGFGSLRNTVFHILAAEEIWFERWNGDPWRAFETEAKGLSLEVIAARLGEVARKRQLLLQRERDSGWNRDCIYKNLKGDLLANPLRDLLVHVANHGVHHRAQALNFLKQFGQTVTGGLDYLFYRLAKPFVAQDPETASSLRQYGLEVATGCSLAVDWDASVIHKYFAYGDWANARALELLMSLSDEALDRSWGMGVDTLRKTALHILDAERWWIRNWTIGPSQFEKQPITTTVQQLREHWSQACAERSHFLAQMDATSAQRVVTALAGGPPIKVPIIESMIQLGCHGTHHRAQLINMLRRSQPERPSLPAFDFVVWLREMAA